MPRFPLGSNGKAFLDLFDPNFPLDDVTGLVSIRRVNRHGDSGGDDPSDPDAPWTYDEIAGLWSIAMETADPEKRESLAYQGNRDMAFLAEKALTPLELEACAKFVAEHVFDLDTEWVRPYREIEVNPELQERMVSLSNVIRLGVASWVQ